MTTKTPPRPKTRSALSTKSPLPPWLPMPQPASSTIISPATPVARPRDPRKLAALVRREICPTNTKESTPAATSSSSSSKGVSQSCNSGVTFSGRNIFTDGAFSSSRKSRLKTPAASTVTCPDDLIFSDAGVASKFQSTQELMSVSAVDFSSSEVGSSTEGAQSLTSFDTPRDPRNIRSNLSSKSDSHLRWRYVEESVPTVSSTSSALETSLPIEPPPPPPNDLPTLPPLPPPLPPLPLLPDSTSMNDSVKVSEYHIPPLKLSCIHASDADSW